MLKGTTKTRPVDSEEDDTRLSDEDLFAYLCRDGMGGFGGMSWDRYCQTPDRIICDSYFAERDEDHAVIVLRQRRRRATEANGKSGNPDSAGRELPSRESLAIPPEAWIVNPQLTMSPHGQSYCLMFWSIWRRRQQEGGLDEDGRPLTDETILVRWRKKVGESR